MSLVGKLLVPDVLAGNLLGRKTMQDDDNGNAFPQTSFILPLLTTLVPLWSAGSGTPTFTRATPAYVSAYAATANLADGQTLIQCASGEARFSGARRVSQGVWSAVDASGAAIPAATLLGYLSEGARTNALLWSNDWTNAAWVKTTMTTAFTSTGPDGVANSATRLTASAGNALALQTIVAAASSRTFSVWIKRITGTGTVELTQDGLAFTAVTVTAGWTQVQLTASQLNAVLGIRIVTNADAVDVWCGQFEAGAFASSAIPTTTASASRNADVLSYPMAGNISGTVGSAYSETTPYVLVNSSYLIADEVDNRVPIYFNAAGTALMYDGTNNPSLKASAYAANTLTKGAVAWSGVLETSAFGGSLGTPGTFDGNFDLGATFAIGGNGFGQLFGNIRNVRIYPNALTNAQLQAMTT